MSAQLQKVYLRGRRHTSEVGDINVSLTAQGVQRKRLIVTHLVINNFVALSETVEVGCPRHPGATTIGNQLQDGDHTDGWQNLTTQP